MIIIENNIVYKIPESIISGVVNSEQMELTRAYGDAKRTAYEEFIKLDCLDTDELNARAVIAAHFGGPLEGPSVAVVIEAWKIITQQYDIDTFVVDIPSSDIAANIHEEPYTAYNLDNDTHIMCEGCRHQVMAYIQWADARKKVHDGTHTYADLLYMIQNNPNKDGDSDDDSDDDIVRVVSVTDDGSIEEISIEEFMEELSGSEQSLTPTHKGSTKIN